MSFFETRCSFEHAENTVDCQLVQLIQLCRGIINIGLNTNEQLKPPWHIKLHVGRWCDYWHQKTNVPSCFDVLHGQASSTLSLMLVAFVPSKTERLEFFRCSWVKKLTSYLDQCALQVGWGTLLPAKSCGKLVIDEKSLSSLLPLVE